MYVTSLGNIVSDVWTMCVVSAVRVLRIISVVSAVSVDCGFTGQRRNECCSLSYASSDAIFH